MDHLKAECKKLQTFHIQCQRRILGIRWSDFVTNSAITIKTGLPDIHVRAVINDRKLALFGHVRRLPENGIVLHFGWRRKPGRP